MSDLALKSTHGVFRLSLNNSIKNLESKPTKESLISFEYDDLKRVTSTTDYYNNTVGYAYDGNDKLTKITYPDNKEVGYFYDEDNRLIEVKDWNNQSTEYTYYKDSRLKTVVYPNDVTTEYTYDSAGRSSLLEHKKDSEVLYYWDMTLDTRGNITSEKRKEAYNSYPGFSSNIASYTHSTTNRMTSNDDKTFGYDDDGNQILINGNNTFTYDINNNITKVESDDFDAIYEYDALGNRRKSTRNGEAIKYVLDVVGLSKVLMETDDAGNPLHYYVHGLQLISRVQPDNETQYYLGDLRGSTIAMVDADAEVTHKYSYTDFGSIVHKEEADTNLFRYVGMHGIQYENDELYFMRARYYNPKIGRFLSEDPIWHTNLYSYADNNPIRYIDRFGQDSEEINTLWYLWNKVADKAEGLIGSGVDLYIHSSYVTEQLSLSYTYLHTALNTKDEKVKNDYLKKYSLLLADSFNYLVSEVSEDAVLGFIDLVFDTANDVYVGWIFLDDNIDYDGSLLIRQEDRDRVKNQIMSTVNQGLNQSSIGWELIFDLLVGVK